MTAIATITANSIVHEPALRAVRRFLPNQYLAHPLSRPDHVFVVRRGWAARYRQLRDGRRQITSLYLTGDTCDIGWLVQRQAIQAVKAITEVEAVPLPREWLERLSANNRRHWAALGNEMALQSSIQSELCLTLGRKTAAERLAQLFSEIWWRLAATSHACQTDCPMPLTQQDMADMTGLTPIHVNRVLKELRDADIISIRARRMLVPDIDRLQRLAKFDPGYLEGLNYGRLHSLV